MKFMEVMTSSNNTLLLNINKLVAVQPRGQGKAMIVLEGNKRIDLEEKYGDLKRKLTR